MQPPLHQSHFAYQSMGGYPTMPHSNLLSICWPSKFKTFPHVMSDFFFRLAGHHLPSNSNYGSGAAPLPYATNGCSNRHQQQQQQQSINSVPNGNSETIMNRETSITANPVVASSSAADLTSFPVANSSSSSSSSSSHYYHSSWNEAKI